MKQTCSVVNGDKPDFAISLIVFSSDLKSILQPTKMIGTPGQ